MSDVILKVENVSKQYQLGTFGTRTIGGDVHRWWTTKVRGKEDPFLKVGEVNDRTSKEKAEFVWALKDINFEVKRGEVLGIIGKNGAGKSTLLKLLSRVTSPTTGTIKSAGRMASLLEVGTGFHPELTGLENIYLNGAILGMTKSEIKRKLEEIIDFSGCALYIDTPVKRYSSGMKVRLGFAVAAFLDPEILVVDEVLAVGDAEFQKKAIGKMQDVSAGEGRTVLFVSHNLDSIKALCPRSILLENGSISMDDQTNNVINKYLYVTNSEIQFKYSGETLNLNNEKHLTREIEILEIVNTCEKFNFKTCDKLKFDVKLVNLTEDLINLGRLSLRVSDKNGTPVLTSHCSVKRDLVPTKNEVISFVFEIPKIVPGDYNMTIWIGQGDLSNYTLDYSSAQSVLHFTVLPSREIFWADSWGYISIDSLNLLK
jgi:lipopolysaccharide transport system ATP-binding protein